MRNVVVLNNPGHCQEKCANKNKAGKCKLEQVKFVLGKCDSFKAK